MIILFSQKDFFFTWNILLFARSSLCYPVQALKNKSSIDFTQKRLFNFLMVFVRVAETNLCVLVGIGSDFWNDPDSNIVVSESDFQFFLGSGSALKVLNSLLNWTLLAVFIDQSDFYSILTFMSKEISKKLNFFRSDPDQGCSRRSDPVIFSTVESGSGFFIKVGSGSATLVFLMNFNE